MNAIQNIEYFKEYVKESIQQCLSYAAETGQWIAQTSTTLKNHIIAVAQSGWTNTLYYTNLSFQWVKNAIVNFPANCMWALNGFWYYLVKGFWMGYDLTQLLFKNLFQGIKKCIELGYDLLRFIPDFFRAVFHGITFLFKQTVNLVQKVIETLLEIVLKIPSILHKLGNALYTTLSNVLSEMLNVIKQIPAALYKMGNTFYNGLNTIITEIINALKHIPTVLYKIGNALYNGLNTIITETLNAIKNIPTVLYKMSNALYNGLSTIITETLNAIKNIPTVLYQMGNALYNGLSTVISTVGDFIKKIPSIIFKLANTALNGLTNAWLWLRPTIELFGKKLSTGIGMIFGASLAVVDLACDGLAFVFGNRFAQLAKTPGFGYAKLVLGIAVGVAVFYQAAKLTYKGIKALYHSTVLRSCIDRLQSMFKRRNEVAPTQARSRRRAQGAQAEQPADTSICPQYRTRQQRRHQQNEQSRPNTAPRRSNRRSRAA